MSNKFDEYMYPYRKLFWIERRTSSTVQIQRSYMDGSNRELFAELNDTIVQSLSIDYIDKWYALNENGDSATSFLTNNMLFIT